MLFSKRKTLLEAEVGQMGEAFPHQKIPRFDNLHREMLVAKEGEVEVVKTRSLFFFEKEAYTQQKEPSHSPQKSLHLSA